MTRGTECSKKQDRAMILTIDLQSVLQCPKLRAFGLYYKTKLYVHNVTVYNNSNESSYCYIWHEAEGGLNVTVYNNSIESSHCYIWHEAEAGLNLTVYNNSIESSHCYIWHEAEAGLSAKGLHLVSLIFFLGTNIVKENNHQLKLIKTDETTQGIRKNVTP
ncbi:hypothetical protein PoB_005947300 [Plakobranchus ocellatus]|uniref:Right handed beta helix domain-containing protein n=1 Tax=Plakobranchus ocellatus TaxID=259542 RepID=A0AAV4CN59_9GAST|nr:hypothetical protein PoB_005947300 [Plakobranchus ocellatus]